MELSMSPYFISGTVLLLQFKSFFSVKSKDVRVGKTRQCLIHQNCSHLLIVFRTPKNLLYLYDINEKFTTFTKIDFVLSL